MHQLWHRNSAPYGMPLPEQKMTQSLREAALKLARVASMACPHTCTCERQQLSQLVEKLAQEPDITTSGSYIEIPMAEFLAAPDIAIAKSLTSDVGVLNAEGRVEFVIIRNLEPHYSLLSWDWKSRPSKEDLQGALKPFGLVVHVDPHWADSTVSAYVISNQEMTEQQLLALEREE